MRVNFNWTNHLITVTVDEEEAQRIAAFIVHQFGMTTDPDADVASRLEDALKEILT